MKSPAHIYNTIAALMALCLVLPSAERIKMRKLRSLTITQAPAQPGYLNDGEPFALRKAPQFRPPAYALPALPIAPDPQPIPLMSNRPAQPLNPAQMEAPDPVEGATIPAMPIAPIQPFRIEVKPTFIAPTIPGQQAWKAPAAVPGAINSRATSNTFLNPEILQYFNTDANGTYRSRILLNGSSLFTLPSMNPLLQRSGSTTYEIK